MNENTQQALAFLERHYRALRTPYTPMAWMRRLFLRLVASEPPRLVDLPTGTGKTDLIVVWLVALAWYAKHRDSTPAIPRRLVWVVNRRVLVQQVYALSERLSALLDPATEQFPAETVELRELLAKLCRHGSKTVFRVVQLRGQMVDDREWSVDPTIPQLIIGTVDQIGSRLLFQGYGLGKWHRPLHAGLLGVDALICIDEAHLVPAFALTLRQVHRFATTPIQDAPNAPDNTAASALGSVFRSLPFWSTELSATPALPRPPHEAILSIVEDDTRDSAIVDRLLAAEAKRVAFDWADGDDDMAARIASAAKDVFEKVGAVAIFCQTVKLAESVEKVLRKDPRIRDRIMLVTGRLRGYERDRLSDTDIFKRFRREADVESSPGSTDGAVYLVGTAAAEVGLDADADAVYCDFAPVPTLLQRLGRLDRRGILSRRSADRRCDPPTMTIFAVRSEPSGHGSLVKTLATALGNTMSEAELFAGAPWQRAVSGGDGESDGRGAAPSPEDLIAEASREILLHTNTPERPEHATSPSGWLRHDFAPVTAGPVVVPPLAPVVLQQWSATTIGASPYLPVHPWLYGMVQNDDGTPLVGLAFRIEMDLIPKEEAETAEDAQDTPSRASNRILDTLSTFPPLRAELHHVPLPCARDWLKSDLAKGLSVAHFDGDSWKLIHAPTKLRPDDILVLGTTADCKAVGKLMGEDIAVAEATRDVLDGVSRVGPRYQRRIELQSTGVIWDLVSADGSCRFVRNGEAKKAESSCAGQPQESPNEGDWRIVPANTLRGEIDGTTVTVRYWKRKPPQQGRQTLASHLSTATAEGSRIADAVAPGNDFLGKLLELAGADHDEGKRYPHWQRAMGNPDLSNPIAKPLVEHPARTGGYRHEWGSLLKIRSTQPDLPLDWPEKKRQLWRDLWLHLVGSHHGYLRPSIPDTAFPRPPTPTKQAPLRLEAVERYASLQHVLGYWRLAYLEGLLRSIDVAASREETEKPDEL